MIVIPNTIVIPTTIVIPNEVRDLQFAASHHNPGESSTEAVTNIQSCEPNFLRVPSCP
jgi:hypothetical protein